MRGVGWGGWVRGIEVEFGVEENALLESVASLVHSSWSSGSRSSNMNSIGSETLSSITWGSMNTTAGRMSRK